MFGLPSSISCRKSRKIEKIWKILRKLKILFGHVKDSQRKIKKIQWKHDELSGKAKDFLMVQQYSKYRFFDLNCILSFCKDPWKLWPPGVLLQNLFQDLSSSCAATYIFLLKKNVNSCRGGSQTPAKTHENCDLQVFFYNKTISELSNNDEISMVSGRGVTGNHNEETTTGKIGKAHERSWKIMKDHKSTNQPDPKLIKPQFILIPKSIKIHHSCKKNDLNMFEYMNCVHNRFENIQWVVSKLLQCNW